MTNIKYYKGETCSLNSILCQEGFRTDCMIYLENKLAAKPVKHLRTCHSKKSYVSQVLVPTGAKN
jgi:hypothetical protein